LVAQQYCSTLCAVACFQNTVHRSVTTIPEIRYTDGMPTRIQKPRLAFQNRLYARGGIVREDSRRQCGGIAGNCRPKCNRERRSCTRLGSISKDPIGFAAGDANQYRYVGNAPTNATDPSGLAEGHHWIPIAVSWELRGEGLLSDLEIWYFSGRMSGDLINGHRYSTKYWGVDHEMYSCEVENQLRAWKKSPIGHQWTMEVVAANIRDGKNWHDRGYNDTLSRFNWGVFYDLKHRSREYYTQFDGGSRDEIVKRGQSSLRKRGKYAVIGTAALGIASLVDAKTQAEDVVKILKDGRGVRNAKAAAEQGDLAGIERCLIGTAWPEESTLEELSGKVPLAFLIGFRKAVEKAMARKQDELKEFDEFIKTFRVE
jgi:hypothetical protein